MNSDILARIALLAPTLSRAEAQVAKWVSAHPRQAADSTLAQWADMIGVSEPTIVRFCRSLGLAGFRDLRPLLLMSLQQPEQFIYQDVDADDDVPDAVGKVLDSSITALVGLRSVAANMPFAEAVQVMAKARQLIFVGLGASGWVARDAQHKFFRLGTPCVSATDIQTILQHAAIAEEGDVLLVVSYSGTWQELVDAAALARGNGAQVIVVTDPSSPLAQVASLSFESHPVEDANVYTPMSSRLVHLALLDALQVALALALGSHAKSKLKESKRALLHFRATGSKSDKQT